VRINFQGVLGMLAPDGVAVQVRPVVAAPFLARCGIPGGGAIINPDLQTHQLNSNMLQLHVLTRNP
jgi:hypothetical protein